MSKVTNLIQFNLELSSWLKIMHWYSDDLNLHELLGEAYDSLTTQLDAMIEVSLSTPNSRDADPIVSNLQITKKKYNAQDALSYFRNLESNAQVYFASLPFGAKAAVDNFNETVQKTIYKLGLLIK